MEKISIGKKSKWFSVIVRIFIAAFLLQTVIRFKFPGHPDSVLIFTQMGMEPWGRYFVAVVETLASILLLIPRFSLYGAFLIACTMLGAIVGHSKQNWTRSHQRGDPH